MNDALKSIALEGGKVSIPLGMALVAGWLYLDHRFSAAEVAVGYLTCLHLCDPTARDMAHCPTSLPAICPKEPTP